MSSTTDIRSVLPQIPPATVLICDDDTDTRLVVGFAVRALGHNVVEADDGVSAQECCERALPDAIVLDIMMPRMTGTDFVRWFRAQYPTVFVPVLLLTALSDVENRVAGFAVGAEDYLTKPFHNRELQARVQSLLRLKLVVESLHQRTAELERSREELVLKERELATARLAGAAAHGLGQPVTSILMHCHLIEKRLGDLSADTKDTVGESLAAVRRECETVKAVVQRLEAADAHTAEAYPSGLQILALDTPLGKKA